MLDLLAEWLHDSERWLGQLSAEDAVAPVLAIVLLAMIVAVLGRHPRTMLETACLSVVAVFMVTVLLWDFPAVIIAAVSIVNAVQGGGRRSFEGHLRAIDRRMAAMSDHLEEFLVGLDRRAREVDDYSREFGEMGIEKVLDAASEIAEPQAKDDHKAAEKFKTTEKFRAARYKATDKALS